MPREHPHPLRSLFLVYGRMVGALLVSPLVLAGSLVRAARATRRFFMEF